MLEISDQEVSGSAASDSEVVVRRSCENVEEDVRQAVAALNEDLNEFHGVSFGDDLQFFSEADSFAGDGAELTAAETERFVNSDVGEDVQHVCQVLEPESLSQMFCSAFINTRKRQQVVMPWETDLAKKIFKKDSILPKPLGYHGSHLKILRIQNLLVWMDSRHFWRTRQFLQRP